MLRRHSPFNITVLYAIFATLWILVSSQVLALFIDDIVWLNYLEIAKGLLFVAVTSILLYLLLKGWRRTILDKESIKVQHESELFISSILDSLTSEIAVLNEQGIIIAVNKAWQEFGKTNGLDASNALLGINYLTICQAAFNYPNGEEANVVYAGIKAVLTGEKERFYLEYPCHSEQQQRWFSLTASPLRGAKCGVVVSHENITERKKTEKALQDSKNLLQFALQTSHTGGWHLNLLDYSASRTLEHDRIFGYETLLPEWTYQMFLDHVILEDRAKVDNLFQTSITNHTDWNFECRIHRCDGEIRWIWAAGKPIADEQGHLSYIAGIIQDITERKLAESTLLEREKEFRLLAEAMPQIVWIAKANGKDIYLNQQWLNYTGLSLEESYGDGWLQAVHPDDIAVCWQAWQSALQSEHPNYCLEYRLRRADGVYRWWLTRGVPILDDKGNIYKWFGTCTDIHDLKETEKNLLEKQRLLADSQAIAHVGSWIIDLNTNTIHWTEESLRLLGLTTTDNDLTVEQFLELLHLDDVLAVQNWAADCLAGRQPAGLEFRTRPIEGVYRWLLGNGILETDVNGKPLRMLGTIQDITERKKAEQIIFDLAYFDPLTHLPNRRLMLDRLTQILISRPLKNRHGAILFINLDNFRTLNDTQGHAIGDLLLMKITQRLKTAVHEDDTIARIGSDEFVLILDALDETTELAATQAESIARRILNIINRPFDLQGYEYLCSASIGVTLFLGHKTSVDDLLKQADMAMHQAKQQGKNTVCFFDPTIQSVLELRVQMEAWLRKAFNGQYQLYYQIQVNNNHQATGAEALLRWHHPQQGIISPSEFIALAEESNLILLIGQWVLRTACLQLKRWEQNPTTRHLILAVNVSAKQFRQIDFVQQVLAVLVETGAAPDKLKLELTESMLVDDIEDMIAKMNELKTHGIKFSIDDFGTGFSSLSYLKRLPLQQLKIDRSFVRDALVDPNDAAIIRAIIALGQSLSMEVIAEGVETEAQRDFLIAEGCYDYQGYLFSKPVPVEEFEQLLSYYTTNT